MREVSQAVMVLLSILVSGCFNGEYEYYLNPDGSGKMSYVITVDANELSGISGFDVKFTEDDAIEGIFDYIERSKGFEAWSDVYFNISDDSTKIIFSATGYFPDYSKMDVGSELSIPIFQLTRTEDGLMRLGPEKNLDQFDIDTEYEPTEEEIEAEFENIQIEMRDIQPMLESAGEIMKYNVVFHLPGEIDEIEVFTKESNSSFSFTYDMKKMMKNILEITNSRKFAKLTLKAKNNDQTPEDIVPYLLGQILSGDEKLPHVIIEKPYKPLFDYGAEVEKAKQEWEEFQKKYGM